MLVSHYSLNQNILVKVKDCYLILLMLLNFLIFNIWPILAVCVFFHDKMWIILLVRTTIHSLFLTILPKTNESYNIIEKVKDMELDAYVSHYSLSRNRLVGVEESHKFLYMPKLLKATTCLVNNLTRCM
ncbi:hypothetical protein RND81_07G060000 [Saponaria officinalis]|uniref:Uncharacterized protein n=1 Tax=Saponaria officinalis TaxID=3572 RepID=A0AAW1JSA7_SAPOF